MTKRIALLRGVNVAGRAMVAMAELKALVTDLGLSDVQTLLQSGNVVFRSIGKKPGDLEAMLEAEAEKRFGRRIDFFVRRAAEWREIVVENPFPAEAAHDPGHLVVACFKAAPGEKKIAALRTAITGREVFHPAGRHAYLIYPDGIGRSKLTNTLIENTLETRATGRNWNTVLKLAALSAT